MYGLLSTSCVGSGWNAIFGQFTEKLIFDICTNKESSPPCKFWQLVTGDNTLAVGPSYHDVLGKKLGYDALGAIANESKFTLRRRCTEFLHIGTEDRLSGHPC